MALINKKVLLALMGAANFFGHMPLKYWTRSLLVWGLAIVLFAVVFLVAAEFGKVHPFLIDGDGFGYFGMLQQDTSSTLFQSGYPYFFGWTRDLSRTLESPLETTLRFSQYVMLAACAVLFFAAASRLFNPWASALMTILLVLNRLVLENIHRTRPEWLTAILGLVLLAILIFWATERRIVVRLAAIAAASVLCSVGVIIKVNFIVFGAVVALMIFRELITKDYQRVNIRPPWLAPYLGALMLALVPALFLSVYVPYMRDFHGPSVHHKSLTKITYQHGWSLMMHLGGWRGQISADDGTASARLVFLNQTLPVQNHVPGDSYGNIDAEPEVANARLTEEGRTIVKFAVGASHAELLEAIDDRGLLRTLPLEFVPIEIIMTTNYYLGLPDGDALLVQGFVEAAMAHPIAFARNLLAATIQFLILKGSPEPLTRLPSVSAQANCQFPAQGGDYGFQQIRSCIDHNSWPARLSSAFTLPRVVLVSFFFIGCMSFFMNRTNALMNDPLRIVLLGAFLMCLLQALFSALVFGFPRAKELMAVYLVYLAFALFSLASLPSLIARTRQVSFGNVPPL